MIIADTDDEAVAFARDPDDRDRRAPEESFTITDDIEDSAHLKSVVVLFPQTLTHSSSGRYSSATRRLSLDRSRPTPRPECGMSLLFNFGS